MDNKKEQEESDLRSRIEEENLNEKKQENF